MVPQEPDERVFLFVIKVAADLGGLGGISNDQLDLLRLQWLDALLRTFGLWNLKLGGRHILGRLDHVCLTDGEVRELPEVETFLLADVSHR